MAFVSRGHIGDQRPKEENKWKPLQEKRKKQIVGLIWERTGGFPSITNREWAAKEKMWNWARKEGIS